MISALRRWETLLRSAAGGESRPIGAPSGFRDEQGNRRPVDEAFLRWRRRGVTGVPVESAEAPDPSLDVALWNLLATGTGGFPHLRRDGPLLEREDVRTIEVWTETELSALHALAWHGLESATSDHLDRSFVAAQWHIEHTQPDNATQRPWAVQVFAALASRDGNAEAGLFAETLLHACQVSMGTADALSRHILADAADWIESLRSRAE